MARVSPQLSSTISRMVQVYTHPCCLPSGPVAQSANRSTNLLSTVPTRTLLVPMARQRLYRVPQLQTLLNPSDPSIPGRPAG